MRKPFCKRYDICLRLAALANYEFDCDCCAFRNTLAERDHGGVMADIFGAGLLLVAIFQPKKWRRLQPLLQKYKETEEKIERLSLNQES